MSTNFPSADPKILTGEIVVIIKTLSELGFNKCVIENNVWSYKKTLDKTFSYFFCLSLQKSLFTVCNHNRIFKKQLLEQIKLLSSM